MADAIEVSGLAKEYGPLRAVDSISFTVPSGQVFAFLGPNGAGKTTTVEILEGLRRRSAGDVRVLGLDPWRDGTALHKRIGVIPQEFTFFEKIRPREAIAYYGALFGGHPDANRILEQVKLLDKATANYDTLSGGQKQKLGLALALSNDPEALFLDEPTTGLDPQARRAIWDVIRTLRSEGRTVFLTTHYLEEAQLLADQVAIIHQGRLIARGEPEELIARFGRPERLVFESPPALAELLGQRLGLVAVSENGRVEVEIREKGDALRVLTVAESSGISWKSFQTRRDNLEDVFVRMVGRMDEGVLVSEQRP